MKPELTAILREPARLIQVAAHMAEADGVTRYISVDDVTITWTTSTVQPPSTRSHWKVMPDFSLFAHTQVNARGVYWYEEVV